MRYVVDTNVLLRYLLNDHATQSPSAIKYLSDTSLEFIIPTQTLCETIWVLTHKVKIHKSALAVMIREMMLKPHFILNMSEVKRGLNFLEKGGDFADGVIAYHVQDYHNACLLTFDKKAQKLAQQLNLTCIEPN